MKRDFLKSRTAAVLLMTFCAVIWAFAYPLNKLGIAQFGITAGMTGSKILFAGVRFFAAGLITLVIALLSGRKVRQRSFSFAGLILLHSLVYIGLRYSCFYIGLSNLSGSRSSILDALGSFLLILLACAVFPDDRLTLRKILGCILGFCGIFLINVGQEASGSFTLAGDGMMLLSALLSACGGILARILSKRSDPVYVTGFALTFGGAMMIAASQRMQGNLPVVTGQGVFYMICLILISSVAFSIYTVLLTIHPVSSITIFNALIPILGVILSCVFLREPFSVRYLLAGVIVAAGVYTVNR